MTTATASPPVTGEQRFVYAGLDWQSYVKISDAFGDRPVRATYDRGRLELMTTSYLHEWWSSRFHQAITALAVELGVEVQSGGSSTLRREFLDQGLEPDKCYFIANVSAVLGRLDFTPESLPAPDLAVEIDISRSSLDRLGIYAALGVPEVWRHDGTTLTIYHRRPSGDYAPADNSLSFPSVPIAALAEFLAETQDVSETACARALQQWVRTHTSPPAGDPPAAPL